MNVSDKLLLIWIGFMWIVFSIWVVAIAPFPLNLGVVAFQLLTGILLVWMMKPNYVRSKVLSE